MKDDDDRVGAWEIAHLAGVGPYAIDSWRIFCRDKLRGLADGYNGEGAGADFEPEWKRVLPMDKELRAYLRWKWLQEGWDWNPTTGKRHKASEALLEAASHGGVMMEKYLEDAKEHPIDVHPSTDDNVVNVDAGTQLRLDLRTPCENKPLRTKSSTSENSKTRGPKSMQSHLDMEITQSPLRRSARFAQEPRLVSESNVDIDINTTSRLKTSTIDEPTRLESHASADSDSDTIVVTNATPQEHRFNGASKASPPPRANSIIHPPTPPTKQPGSEPKPARRRLSFRDVPVRDPTPDELARLKRRKDYAFRGSLPPLRRLSSSGSTRHRNSNFEPDF